MRRLRESGASSFEKILSAIDQCLGGFARRTCVIAESDGGATARYFERGLAVGECDVLTYGRSRNACLGVAALRFVLADLCLREPDDVSVVDEDIHDGTDGDDDRDESEKNSGDLLAHRVSLAELQGREMEIVAETCRMVCEMIDVALGCRP